MHQRNLFIRRHPFVIWVIARNINTWVEPPRLFVSSCDCGKKRETWKKNENMGRGKVDLRHEEELAEVVRKFTYLYDKSSVSYKDKRAKANACTQIFLLFLFLDFINKSPSNIKSNSSSLSIFATVFHSRNHWYNKIAIGVSLIWTRYRNKNT